MSRTQKHYIAVLLLIALGVIVYANSFSNPFIWDDQNLIVINPYIKDLSLVKYLFTKDLAYGMQFSNFYRPLQSLSFALDYSLWGLSPFGFHLTNFLLHAACAVLIYFLLNLIFPTLRFAPLLTAILFLIHPIQTEAVTYISGRADPLVSLFMLLSILFYLKYSTGLKLNNDPYAVSDDYQRYKPRFGHFACAGLNLSAAVLCFVLALLSKETALILPLLILLCELKLRQAKFRFKPWFNRCYWPFLLVALIYILLRVSVLNFLPRPLLLAKATLFLRLLTSIKALIIYLNLLILPLHLHMERSLAIVSSVWELETLGCLVLFLALVVLIVKSYRAAPRCFFASIWLLLNLIPVSNIVPLNANMAEHWLYLPSMGYFLLICLGLEWVIRRRPATKIFSLTLIVTIICAYSLLTIRRNRDWRDPLAFFQSILDHNPRSAEAHNCLGAIYEKEQRLNLASFEFKQAIKVDPQDFKSYSNLGSVLRKKGEYDLAINAYKKALSLCPSVPGLYNNLANVYADKGDRQKAEQMLSQALRLYPEFSLAKANLGKLYYQSGDIQAAIGQYQQAITLEPSLVFAHYNLALAYHSQQRYDLAIDEYKQVIEMDPGNVTAHLNLGTAYNMNGALDQAIAQYQQALQLDPDFFHALHNLGVVYYKQNKIEQAADSFRRALTINPEYQPSKESLQKIKK